MKASLLVIHGNKEGVFQIPPAGVVIGRAMDGSVGLAIDSPIVSRTHGYIFPREDRWYYRDLGSTNGSFVNEKHIYPSGDRISDPVPLSDGDIIRIDNSVTNEGSNSKGVLLFFSVDNFNDKYDCKVLDLTRRCHYDIGRASDNDIILDSINVSRHHCEIRTEAGCVFFKDKASLNRTLINGVPVTREVMLKPKDVLLVGNTKVIFSGNSLYYKKSKTGGYLTVRNLTRVVNDSEHFGQKKTILNNVSVDIAEGKLVAILGTSGAGKTTFMNCLIGYEEATSGTVLINGIDVYKNKQHLKKQVGYVPQDDLLRGGLTLNSTLQYTGKLRLPHDVSNEERQRRIDSLLDDLELNRNLKKSKIQKLSGGQRKRASIASELISDPPLLFLDEPTSGLDPETETGLINLLSNLAHSQGKTLLVVTHTIQNIMLFDEVLFFGPGGNLFFAGPPGKAMATYHVENFIDLYKIVRTHYTK